jgi:hypothetical protein
MKWNRVGWALVLAFALCAGVVAGCFMGGGGTACYQEEPKGCTEFTGSIYSKAMVESSCEFEVRSGCPTEDLVAKCSLNTNAPNEFVIFYYAPEHSQETAEQTCDEANGDFMTP